VLLGRVDEERELGTAGRAPGAPLVDDDRVPAQIGELGLQCLGGAVDQLPAWALFCAIGLGIAWFADAPAAGLL
jgi:hypothetical protein